MIPIYLTRLYSLMKLKLTHDADEGLLLQAANFEGASWNQAVAVLGAALVGGQHYSCAGVPIESPAITDSTIREYHPLTSWGRLVLEIVISQSAQFLKKHISSRAARLYKNFGGQPFE